MKKEVLNTKSSRNSGNRFELKEGTGAIIAMYSHGSFLEIYKIDKTFQVLTPNGVDPEQINPDAPWVITPTDDVGSTNPIISRILIQSDEILKSASLSDEVDKDSIKILLYDFKEHLLTCQKIANKIRLEVDEAFEKIRREGILNDNYGHTLNPFPHIPDLKKDCSTFLIHANKAIRKMCELPSRFIKLDRIDNNFDDLSKRLARYLEIDSPLIQLINSQRKCIKHIIELRNYEEHSKEKQKTVIKNIHLTPQGQLASPQWFVSGEEATPIKEDMEKIVNYLLELTEWIFIHLIMYAVNIPCSIQTIEPSQINPHNPIKYRLVYDF